MIHIFINIFLFYHFCNFLLILWVKGIIFHLYYFLLKLNAFLLSLHVLFLNMLGQFFKIILHDHPCYFWPLMTKKVKLLRIGNRHTFDFFGFFPVKCIRILIHLLQHLSNLTDLSLKLWIVYLQLLVHLYSQQIIFANIIILN